MKLLILIGLLVLYKFLTNFINFWKCKSYFLKYQAYSKNPQWEFHQESTEIKHLFRSAGLEDGLVPFLEPAGHGQLLSGNVSVMNNLLNTVDQKIVGNVVGLFHQAIGVYRHQMWQAFSPLYWVNTFIFLPREVLGYMGLDTEKVVVKIFQIIYWFLATTIGFFYGVYKETIDALIKGWISHLVK